jgi:hypothetical protein
VPESVFGVRTDTEQDVSAGPAAEAKLLKTGLFTKWRGGGPPLAREGGIMQIPYDIEFVENRPTVAARAVPLHQPMAVWRDDRSSGQRDALGRLLHWAFRLLRRFETR